MRAGCLSWLGRAAAAVVVSLAAAAPAHGGTASVAGETLTYIAAPAEDNRVVASVYYGRDVSISDDVPVVAGPGCQTDPGGGSADCRGPIDRIVLHLGDEDDQAWVGTFIQPGAGFTVEIHGGPGADDLYGGADRSEIYGDADDDHLEGGAGPDLLDGGDGHDWQLRAGDGDDVLIGGDGHDGLDGEGGTDRIEGGPGIDELNGHSAWWPRDFHGVDGADTLLAGPGDDRLNGHGEGDVISGGEGSDTLYYSAHRDGVTVTLDGEPGDGASGEGDQVASDIEAVNGGFGPDVLVGEAGQNWLFGSEGDDVLVGGGGGDRLAGDDGADRLYGGAGPPDVPPAAGDGADGGDELSGNLGDDTLLGSEGHDLFESHEGHDRIDAREPDGGPEVPGESVFCGTGDDFAALDGDDAVDRCETTERSGRPASPLPPEPPSPGPYSPLPWPPWPGPQLPSPGPGLPPASTDTAELTVVLLEEPTVTADDGDVVVKMRCLHASGGRCRGQAGATAAPRLSLGRKSFAIKSRRRSVVRVPLSRTGRKLVRRRGRLRARVSVRFTNPAGPPVEWSDVLTIRRAAL